MDSAMNADAKSTNDIRMIAQEVVEQKAQVCEARRENLVDKLAALAETVGANADAISKLTGTVASLVTAVSVNSASATDQGADIDKLKESVARLKGRPAMWAALGAAVGAAAPIVVDLILAER